MLPENSVLQPKVNWQQSSGCINYVLSAPNGTGLWVVSTIIALLGCYITWSLPLWSEPALGLRIAERTGRGLKLVQLPAQNRIRVYLNHS